MADPRFLRQTVLAGIGDAGQARIAAGRVLVVGAGGLGCPAALYLAAAGVGHITLADHDTVEVSNLHRQVLYTPEDIGLPKVEVAADRLRQGWPGTMVDALAVRVGPTVVEGLVARHDLVLDGTDDPETRTLVHDACVRRGVPLVSAAVHGWEGQVATVVHGGPCLRCLFPRPARAAPSCAQTGVLGAVTGVLGAMQAAEALKLLAGAGDPLKGRLLLFDALAGTWDVLPFTRRDACPVCAQAPAAPSPVRSPSAVRPGAAVAEEARFLTWDDVADAYLLDVREAREVAAHPLAEAHWLPQSRLEEGIGTLPWDLPIAVCCATGATAELAARTLRRHGLDARVVAGGLAARPIT